MTRDRCETARQGAARGVSRREVVRRGAGTIGAALAAGGLPGVAAGQEASPVSGATPGPSPSEVPIDHIVVFFFENHTFDNLYGLFPGANGLAQAGAAVPQVDLDGHPYETLPQPVNLNATPPAQDDRFPDDLPNAPFPIEPYAPID